MKRILFSLLALALLAHPSYPADTYTSSCRVVQMPTGSNDNTWGTKANAAWAMLEACVAGTSSISVTAGNVTLSTANNSADQARMAVLVFTGTPGTTRTITMPDVSKLTWVVNNSDSSLTFTAGAGTTATVTTGKKALIFTDGATNASSLSGVVDLASNVTGTLAVTNGGTGSTTSTGTGAVVRATSPTLTTPTIGVATATSVNKVAITAPATGATLAIADGKTLTVSNDATISGTSSGTNTGDQTISLSGDVSGSGTGSITATLPTTGVTAATYAYPASITFDAKGRATSATAGVAPATALLASGNVSAVNPTILTQAVSSWSSYRRIEFQFENLTAGSSGYFVIRFSTDGGSSFVSSNTYNEKGFYFDGTATSQSGTNISYVICTVPGTSVESLSAKFTGLNNTAPAVFVEIDGSVSGIPVKIVGSNSSLSNVNAVTFFWQTANSTGGTYRVIGYR